MPRTHVGGFTSGASVLVQPALVGLVVTVGAALFHPEGARFANKVSGASKGTGLSLFSIGGNSGFVFGPMLAVAAIGAFGMPGTSVFGLIALVMSVILLYQISHLSGMKKTETEGAKAAGETEEVKNNWKELNPVQMLIYPNHSALNCCWLVLLNCWSNVRS